MDALADKLTRLLADLGDSPDAVAAFLEGQGVTGCRMQATHCPVAEYLKRATGHRRVAVDMASVITLGERGDLGAHALTPVPVSDFIERFDRGLFPALIATGG